MREGRLVRRSQGRGEEGRKWREGKLVRGDERGEGREGERRRGSACSGLAPYILHSSTFPSPLHSSTWSFSSPTFNLRTLSHIFSNTDINHHHLHSSFLQSPSIPPSYLLFSFLPLKWGISSQAITSAITFVFFNPSISLTFTLVSSLLLSFFLFQWVISSQTITLTKT